MPSLSGLTFKDRVAQRPDGKLVFRCTGAGHRPITKTVASQRELKAVIADHDREHHEEREARAATPKVKLLGESLDRYRFEHDQDLANGIITEKTHQFYMDRQKGLLSVWPRSLNLAALTQERIDEFVAVRGSRKLGKSRMVPRAAIRKDLEYLRSLCVWRAVAMEWAVPSRRKVKAPNRPKAKVQPPLEQVLAWIAAMPAGSAAHAFSVTKFLTGLRDVELYAANVEDVDWDEGRLRYRERAKQSGEMRTAILLPTVITALRAHVGDRTSGPLFLLRGRRLADTRLRYPLRKASIDAGITPPIERTAFLRGRFGTLALDALQGKIGLVSQAMEHAHISTTERFYVDRERDKSPIKRRVAKAVERRAYGRTNEPGNSKKAPKSATLLSNLLKKKADLSDS